MMRGNYAIPYWGLVIIFGGYAIMQLTINPLTWDSAVAVVLFLVLVMVIPLIRMVYRKIKYCNPFEFYYEPTLDKKE